MALQPLLLFRSLKSRNRNVALFFLLLFTVLLSSCAAAGSPLKLTCVWRAIVCKSEPCVSSDARFVANATYVVNVTAACTGAAGSVRVADAFQAHGIVPKVSTKRTSCLRVTTYRTLATSLQLATPVKRGSSWLFQVQYSCPAALTALLAVTLDETSSNPAISVKPTVVPLRFERGTEAASAATASASMSPCSGPISTGLGVESLLQGSSDFEVSSGNDTALHIDADFGLSSVWFASVTTTGSTPAVIFS